MRNKEKTTIENKVKTTIAIAPILLDKAREYSKLNTISVSTLITLALNEYLGRHTN